MSVKNWETMSDDELFRDIDTQLSCETDPLDGLVEATKENIGAPFRPEVLAALADLKSADHAAFETTRAALKAAGARVGELDRALAGSDRKTSIADRLVELVSDAKLFCTPDGEAYADVIIAAHRETHAVDSMAFRRYLTALFYEETGSAPNNEAMQTALATVAARAAHDGHVRKVYVRVASADGALFIDLVDDKWRAVEVTADRWRIVESPPVRFRRAAGALPLPEPLRGGSLDALRALINVTDADFPLVIAWLEAALGTQGPYPVLAVSGEQGTAKSSFCRTMRGLVDPNAAPLRNLPRDERDLFIGAQNGHVQAFDNVSTLSIWLSDAICRLATGGGYVTRKLYTNGEEYLIDAMRPVILNGITDVADRGDLASRSLVLTLQPIPEDARRTEEELRVAVDAGLPGIFGALLDAMSEGLQRLPTVVLDGLPRMADFARWGAACDPSGRFTAAYAANCEQAARMTLEADPVATALRSFMSTSGTYTGVVGGLWSGTHKELLEKLGIYAGDFRHARTWPATPRALRGALRRAAPGLRAAGVRIAFGEHGREGSKITVKVER